MSNYSQPNGLRAKLTGLCRVLDIVARFLSVPAMVGRLSVSPRVGSAATPRALFKSHALPHDTSVAVVCGRSRGGA